MSTNLKKQAGLRLLALFSAALAGCTTPDVDQDALALQAQDITQQFMATLQPTLQAALASGGPVNAIEVCSTEAPAIADELSAETSWSISRVSLKPRNSQRGVPDDWERGMLESLDDRQQAGETAATLNDFEIIGGEFRYMQAQITMPLCLTCHGSDLTEEVASALHDYYPDDLAIGYEQGDVRGGISLRFALE